MVYELIATNIDIKSCEMKCENKGGILPQDFGMLAIDDIYISGAVKVLLVRFGRGENERSCGKVNGPKLGLLMGVACIMQVCGPCATE